MREEVRLWWRQAEDDFKVAKKNLTLKNYATAVFYCQQTAEKALKALFIHKLKRIHPKTHNLLEIAKPLKTPAFIFSLLRDLNPEYVTTRYPDAANGLPSDMYDRPLALQHLRKAGRVLEWVKKQIKK